MKTALTGPRRTAGCCRPTVSQQCERTLLQRIHFARPSKEKKQNKNNKKLCVIIILDLDHQPVDVKSSWTIGKDGRKKTTKKSQHHITTETFRDLDFSLLGREWQQKSHLNKCTETAKLKEQHLCCRAISPIVRNGC